MIDSTNTAQSSALAPLTYAWLGLVLLTLFGLGVGQWFRGVPSGQKWAGIAAQAAERRYLVCNGAEGEPGTFKDRALIRANPYQLVEGVMIAMSTIDAAESYICLKRSIQLEIDLVTHAVAEFQEAGLCGGCTVTIVAGPDEYLYGEEKAMLEVIEGKDPLPRWLPPYVHGFFATDAQLGWQSTESDVDTSGLSGAHPTLVNNVETLSNVPHILAHGAEWFHNVRVCDAFAFDDPGSRYIHDGVPSLCTG